MKKKIIKPTYRLSISSNNDGTYDSKFECSTLKELMGFIQNKMVTYAHNSDEFSIDLKIMVKND